MKLSHLWNSLNRRLRKLMEAEIPTQPTDAYLMEAGSLQDAAEQTGAAPSLSVALLQLGLISHLPEAYPIRNSALPSRK